VSAGGAQVVLAVKAIRSRRERGVTAVF